MKKSCYRGYRFPPEVIHQEFDLAKSPSKNVSDVREARTVDLLPSSIDLIDVQDRLATVPSGKFYAYNPIDILRRVSR